MTREASSLKFPSKLRVAACGLLSLGESLSFSLEKTVPWALARWPRVYFPPSITADTALTTQALVCDWFLPSIKHIQGTSVHLLSQHARMPQHPVLPKRSLLSAFIKCLRNYEPALYKHKFLRSDWKQGRYLALPVCQMVITSARADNASSDALKLGCPTRLASLGTTNSTFISVLPFLLCKASRHTFSGSSGIPASGTGQPANTEV